MIRTIMKMHELLSYAENKTLICFGAGKQLLRLCNLYYNIDFFNHIDLIADNNQEKKMFVYENEEKKVYSINECLELSIKEPLVLVTVVEYMPILKQLDSIQSLNYCRCIISEFLEHNFYCQSEPLPRNRTLNELQKIPKVIHYCWFGKSSISENLKRYMASWKKFCPDYEIVRWDESNYDYKKNEYMYEAYRQKRWGFVPDYARLDIIYQCGGVYLDTDVELIRNIDDLLCDDAYCGMARAPDEINNGLGFGAIKGFSLLKEALSVYDNISFINEDGTTNLTSGPYYHTEFLLQRGLRFDNRNKVQQLENMTIYPSDVLDPAYVYMGKAALTENTYSIHHYSWSWQDEDRRQNFHNAQMKLRELYEKVFG